MKKILFIISAAAMLLCGSCSHEEYECDVCVYGGTSSGVIAAYAVAKQGKKVLLVEPAYRLGGLSSGGLGMTDIGNKQVVKGLSLDFYRRVGQHYGALEQWIFEPSVAESIFKGYIERGQIEVLYGHRILEATKQDTQLTSIKLENVEKFCGRATVKAKVYIDCSYEGDLMARSGVSYTVGREPNSQYNENWNGVQMRQYHQFPDGVDPYVVEGDPKSGLLWGISPEPLAEQGSGDSKVQAYNYRMCLTDVKENAIPITRPDDYDSTKYELLLRLIKAKGDNSIHSYLHFSHMPNRKTDINNNGGFSSDMIGMNHNYPEASYKEREKIIEAHRSYTFGLLWFLGHDERVPEKIRNEMLRWGLPKDEYVEYGHWTPQLYIREARRMVGEYVTTQANCDNRTTVEDGIGMAAYTMDSHNCQRVVIVKDGKAMVKNEGDVQIHGGLPYDISYRSITPKREECSNLLVPVCLSASHIAYGSIRMEPVFMLLGQSAAKAACLAIDGGVKVQEVDYRDIQRMYEVDPLLDGTAADIVIDDTAIEVDEKSDWKRIKANNGYGRSYFTLDPVRGERRLRFPFEVKESGKYKVYTYYINLWNAGTKVTELELFDGKQKQTLWLDAAKIVVKGQTSGEWVLLGEYELSAGEKGYVDFTNNGKVTGKVVADAVLLVKSK
ncbi:MAG: FAD-dependent oxidoreductase [Alistipes sp.]|nr:FAD-dependent oxidoreductase [Alistipes sp.]